jgi:hypothetical protein
LESNYSGKSSEELTTKQFEIQKQISYDKAKSYLAMVSDGKSHSALVSDGKSHSALVKMNFKGRSDNWKRNPELSKYYHEWKNSVKEYTTFINRNSPTLRRLQLSYKNRQISRDRYYKERQKALSDLRNKFPHDYDSLNRKFQFDLKKLWLKTGEFYLKSYKAEDKMFPSEWIEDKYIKEYTNSSFYKSLKKELDYIENEIIKRI